MSYLGCVCDSLSVWEYVNNELELKCFDESARNDNILKMAWNHNGQVIATVSNINRKISLWHSTEASLVLTLPFSNSAPIVDDMHSVCFSHNSRYVASAIGSTVGVFDLKTKGQKCSLSHRNTVSSAIYYYDSTIFSGDIAGNLYSWDVRSEDDLYTPLILPSDSTVPITTVKLSNVKSPHFVVCGKEDGRVSIADVNTFDLINSLSVHGGSVMDIFLSPRNAKLFTSVGSDNYINLIDISASRVSDETGRVRPSAQFRLPEYSKNKLRMGTAQCISGQDNGFIIGVGTNGGHVLLFDWRNTRVPLCEEKICSSLTGVNDLCFKTVQVKSTAALSPAASIASSSGSKQRYPKQEAVSEISAITLDNFEIKSTVTLPENTVKRDFKPHSNNHTDAHSNIHDKVDVKEPNSSTTLTHAPEEHQKLPKASEMSLKFNEIIKTPAKPFQVLNSKLKEENASAEVMRAIYPSAAVNNIQTTFPATPLAVAVAPVSTEDQIEELREGLKPVNQDYLAESLDMLRYDMHRDMQDIIREQIRLFSIAKDENESMFRLLSEKLDGLLRDNESLRLENAQLRQVISKSKYSMD